MLREPRCQFRPLSGLHSSAVEVFHLVRDGFIQSPHSCLDAGDGALRATDRADASLAEVGTVPLPGRPALVVE